MFSVPTHGEVRTSHYDNDTIKQKATHKEGLIHGEYVGYYANGNIESKGTIKKKSTCKDGEKK